MIKGVGTQVDSRSPELDIRIELRRLYSLTFVEVSQAHPGMAQRIFFSDHNCQSPTNIKEPVSRYVVR
jgi:hypothetical protein